MPVQTKVIWGPNTTSAERQQVGQKGDELVAQQTAPFEMLTGQPEPDQTTVYRFWVDQASAEYWISYIAQFNPIQSIIVE